MNKNNWKTITSYNGGTILSKNISTKDLTKVSPHMAVFGNEDEIKNNFIIPNLLQNDRNNIVIDPDCKIFREIGKTLENNGCTVEVFSLRDMKHSNCYNMFDYIYKGARGLCGIEGGINESAAVDKDKLFKVITTFVTDTKSNETPLLKAAEKKLMMALCLYLEEDRPEELNLYSLFHLIKMGKEAINILFSRLGSIGPSKEYNRNSIPYYEAFNALPEETKNIVFKSLEYKLSYFKDSTARDLLSTAYTPEKKYSNGTAETIYIRSNENLDLVDYCAGNGHVLFIDLGEDEHYFWIVSVLIEQIYDIIRENAIAGHTELYGEDNWEGTRFILNFSNINENWYISSLKKMITESFIYNLDIKDGCSGDCISFVIADKKWNKFYYRYENSNNIIMHCCGVKIYFSGSNERINTEQFESVKLGDSTIKKQIKKQVNLPEVIPITSSKEIKESFKKQDVQPIDNKNCLIYVKNGVYFDEVYDVYNNHPEWKNIILNKNINLFDFITTSEKPSLYWDSNKPVSDEKLSVELYKINRNKHREEGVLALFELIRKALKDNPDIDITSEEFKNNVINELGLNNINTLIIPEDMGISRKIIAQYDTEEIWKSLIGK